MRSSSNRRRLVLGIVVVAACSSKPAAVSPPPSTPSGSAVAASRPAHCPEPTERPEGYYRARRKELRDALGQGRNAQVRLGSAKDTDADLTAAATGCAKIPASMSGFCFEGIAQAYGKTAGAMMTSNAKGVDAELAAFNERMARLDAKWTLFYCRGLGAGLHTGGVRNERMAALLPSYEAVCRNKLIEGFAQRLITAKVDLSKPAGPDALDGFSQDEVCKGLDGAWCGFGVGRSIGNALDGNFDVAVRGCSGPHRDACIAGLAYVMLLIWEPDRMERAFAPLSTMAPADRAGYVEGLATALSWFSTYDPAGYRASYECLLPDDRARIDRVVTAAKACGFVDFRDGTNCRWADAYGMP